MVRRRAMSRQVATAMSAGLGEVLAIWYVANEEPVTDQTPEEEQARTAIEPATAEEAPVAGEGRAASEDPATAEGAPAAGEGRSVGEDPATGVGAPAAEDDPRPDVVYVCENGIALGGADGEGVIASCGWADVTSFRWSKLIDNSYDSRAGAVSTRISFLVDVEADGRDARVAFESAAVVTPGTDFFARGADWPDLPDEWTLYRAEGEITAAALPRFRARLGAGETAGFGAVTLSPEGVRHEGRLFPWASVAGAGFRVGNPDPGAKEPDTGTWLHVSLHEPVAGDDGAEHREIVVPAFEVDFMDALITLVNDQASWTAAQGQRGW
ncbi:MAG TPA: hypothetical protein VF060_23230 [Trebonia sp.]